MGFRTPVCWRRQKVRVVEPNGQLRRFPFTVSVPDLLRLYPHHYLRHHVSGSILAADAELEGGDTYMLLPLPKLFPCSAAACCDECKGLKRQRDSNPRPQAPSKCEGFQRKRRAGRPMKAWEPSLDIIAENAMLLQTKEDEDKSVKKISRQPVKYRLENYVLKKEPWYLQRRLNVSVGFIF